MDASQFSVSGFLPRVWNSVLAFFRRLLLWILSAGPIPQHIAVIMDGNRRFADRRGIDRTAGHVHGYESLMRVLKDCFDLRVKFVTLYAFSIDNFQRPSGEVSALMELMQSKLEALTEKEGLAREHGVRVNILGDLSLLPEGVRNAAERAMAATRRNNSAVLNLCISYTSTQEIVHSVQSVRNDFVYKLGKGYEGADSQSDRERLQNGVMEGSLDVPSTGLRKRSFHAKQVSSYLSAATGSEVEDVNFKLEARKENFPNNAKKKGHPSPFPETLNSPIDIAPRKNFLKYRIIEDDDVGTNASSSNCLLKMGEHIRMESVVCSKDDKVSSEQRAGENRQDAVSAIAEGRAGFKGQPATNTTEVNGFRARDYQGSSLHENGLPNNCACGHHDDSADKLPQFLIDRITENEIQQHLYTDSCPPPDTVLRTSGETRLSNFLLWQSSFSHLAFCKVLWPDFSFRHLFSVIFEYQRAYSDISRKRHLCNQILCQSHEISCSSVWAS